MCFVLISFLSFQEIDIISAAAEDSQINERNKRTIGILRELFPELSKVSQGLTKEFDDRKLACLYIKQKTIILVYYDILCTYYENYIIITLTKIYTIVATFSSN